MNAEGQKSGGHLGFLQPLSPAAILAAFLAITFPLWCNAYLSPPDSASYLAVARTLVLGGELDFYDDYKSLAFELNFFYLTDEERISNDWPAGSAVAWTPPYALAHGAALLFRGENFEPNGHSGVYRLLVSLWVAALVLGGLVLGIQVAEPFSGKKAALGATFCVLLGTPLGFYLYAYALMSHGTSMAAVSLLIWGWHRTRGEREIWQWAALGAVAGVMAMIRPQNLAFLAIFLVEFMSLGREFFSAWRRRLAGIGAAAGAAVLAFSPQMILWGSVYGNALQLPKIEEMHWLRPQVLGVLFSDYHGLLSWSPVLVLFPVGLFFLYRKDRVLAVALGVAVLLQFYLTAVNEIRWAGGSFGNRRFVNCSLPFLVGIAAALRGMKAWLGASVAVVLSGWNFLLIAMERSGRLSLDHYEHWDGGFFVEAMKTLDPRIFFPGLMGDFAGFGWIARAIATALGLGLAGWLQWRAAGSLPLVSQRVKKVAALLGAGWFLVLAPGLFLVAAARTHPPDYAEIHPEFYRYNASLFNGFYEYGFYLAQNERFEEALEAYEKAAELAPGKPFPYRYMATIELELGRLEEALEHSGRALDIAPSYTRALEIERRVIMELWREDRSRTHLLRRLADRFRAAGNEAEAEEVERFLEENEGK